MNCIGKAMNIMIIEEKACFSLVYNDNSYRFAGEDTFKPPQGDAFLDLCSEEA